MSDPYRTLGVDRDASFEEIRAAYRRLISRWHPDRHAGASDDLREASARRTAEITAAFQLLNDPQALARFEAKRRRRPTGEGSSTPGTGPEPTPGPSRPFDYRRAARSEFDGVRRAPGSHRPSPEPTAGSAWTARSSAAAPARPRRSPRRRPNWSHRSRLLATALVIVLCVPPLIVAIVLGIRSGLVSSDAGATVQIATRQQPSALRVGDCFNRETAPSDTEGRGRVRSVRVVPCTGPHESMVLDTFELEAGFGAPYPGRESIAATAGPVCRAANVAVADADPAAGLNWIYPSRESWGQGDRRVVCARSSDLR